MASLILGVYKPCIEPRNKSEVREENLPPKIVLGPAIAGVAFSEEA